MINVSNIKHVYTGAMVDELDIMLIYIYSLTNQILEEY